MAKHRTNFLVPTAFQLAHLQKIADGKRLVEIAAEEGRSKHAVAVSLWHARQTLFATSTGHAVAICIRKGLLK